VSNSPQTYNGSPQSATVAISAARCRARSPTCLTVGAATRQRRHLCGDGRLRADDTTNYNTLPRCRPATSSSTRRRRRRPWREQFAADVLRLTAERDGRDLGSSVPGAVANVTTTVAPRPTNAATYAVTADFVPTDTTNYNTLPRCRPATSSSTRRRRRRPWREQFAADLHGSPQSATVAISAARCPARSPTCLTGGAATQTTPAPMR
jgi:hypothetical protein